MHFEKESTVTHPAAEVLELMIERMEDIVPFMPNVDGIEVQSRREDADGRPIIVRRWQGRDTSAPKAVRPFLTQDVLAWIDTAHWFPEQCRVDWTLQTVAGGGLYDCAGSNYFEPHPTEPGHTRIRITGELSIFPERLAGVPKFLGKRMAPQIEAFVVKLITPNLTDVAVGMQSYFDARAGG